MYKSFVIKNVDKELDTIFQQNPNSEFVTLVPNKTEYVLILNDKPSFTPKGLSDNTKTNSNQPSSKQINYLRTLLKDTEVELPSVEKLETFTKRDVSKMINFAKNGKLDEVSALLNTPATKEEIPTFTPDMLDNIDFS